jgi:hypothetical protein
MLREAEERRAAKHHLDAEDPEAARTSR